MAQVVALKITKKDDDNNLDNLDNFQFIFIIQKIKKSINSL